MYPCYPIFNVEVGSIAKIQRRESIMLNVLLVATADTDKTDQNGEGCWVYPVTLPSIPRVDEEVWLDGLGDSFPVHKIIYYIKKDKDLPSYAEVHLNIGDYSRLLELTDGVEGWDKYEDWRATEGWYDTSP